MRLPRPAGIIVRMAGDAEVWDGILTEGEDAQLEFLETDPFFYGSGYLRERVARRLARASLTDEQRDRARAVVLGVVDGRLHTPIAAITRLGRAVADNQLRVALRARLHGPDRIASRALRVVVSVRHPGYTTADLEVARAIVLRDMRESPYRFASPIHVRLAFRLWAPQWEQELRDVAVPHGPDRAAARELLRIADARREKKRPGP